MTPETVTVINPVAIYVGGIGIGVMGLLYFLNCVGLLPRRNNRAPVARALTDEEWKQMTDTPTPVREIHKAILDPYKGVVVIQRETVEKLKDISEILAQLKQELS